MDTQENNVMRNELAQLSGILTDSAFNALVTAYNWLMDMTLRAAQAGVGGAMWSYSLK